MLRIAVLLALLAGPAARAELTVSGQVVDERGRGLAGAEVTLVRTPTPWHRLALLLGERIEPEATARAVTDADGAYALDVPEPDMWTLTVTVTDRVPMTRGPAALVEDVRLDPVEMSHGLPVEIRVVDGADAPLDGTWIEAESDRGRRLPPGPTGSWEPASARLRTDAHGRAVVYRRPGEGLRVTAHPATGAAVQAEAVQRDTTLRVQPLPVRALRFTRPDGHPITGAVVTRIEEEWPLGRTDPDGRLALPLSAGDPPRFTLVLADGGRGTVVPDPAGEEPAEEIVVEIDEPRLLHGRVVDARSRSPLAGAVVSHSLDSGLRTSTGSDGLFQLRVPSGVERWVTVAAAGHSRGGGNDPDVATPIELSPTWTVRGVVLDPTRQPLAGVSVIAFPRLDGGRGLERAFGAGGRTLTRPNGTFEVRGLVEGLSYSVTAGLPDVGQTEAVVRPDDAERPLTLVLEAGATLTGQILDDADSPVAGAALVLEESRDGARGLAWTRRLLDPRRPPRTATADDGTFALEHVASATWDLQITADGYAAERVEGIELTEGRAVDLGILRLAPGLELAGRVEDPDAAPVEGAVVEITAQRDLLFASPGMPPPQVTTDAEGWFSIPDRRAGDELTLRVRHEGFVAKEVPGVIVGAEPPVIELARGARLTGTILDPDGGAVSGATVLARPEAGAAGPGGQVWDGDILAGSGSDRDGRFTVTGLPAGRIALDVEADGWLREERSGIEVSPERDASVTIRLRRGATVEGRVLAADGAPIEEAFVGLAAGGRTSARDVETDEEGRYRLEGVEPGLRMIGATTAEGRSVSHELDVAPGVNGLDLVFERGWPVSGVVLGPTGEPVAEALLVLAGDSRAWSGLDARSDGGGAFRFEDVADGTYWLRAEHPDHATTRLEEPVEVEAPVAGLELRMAAGTRLVGTLSGLEESTARRTEVFARDGTTGFEVASVAADGSFTIPALAPGEWTVMASAPDGRRATEIVSIAAGEREVRVDLSFIDGLTLTGTVLLAGEALTGARLVLRNRDIADSAWGRTDHRGRFEIRGLEPGRYGLVVSRFQDGLHHQEELSLSDDREVLIEIERHRVAGRVVDADGDVAVTDAVVQLRPRGADPALFPTGMLGPGTRSDSTGAFALGNVDAGVYEISALQDGYARLDRQLTVGPGDVEDLVLRLKRTEGALLRVLLPDAAAARSIAVVALDPGSGVPIDGGRFMATTAGDVRLASIPDGRWTLVVSSADAAVAEITVQVPGEAETVQLGPGTRLDVVVPALSGPVVPAATLTLQDPLGPFFRHPGSGELRQRWPIWNGRTTVENLPAGAWIVRVEATDGQRWDETVTVQAGGTQTVEIR